MDTANNKARRGQKEMHGGVPMLLDAGCMGSEQPTNDNPEK
jgi:hypothetical protein